MWQFFTGKEKQESSPAPLSVPVSLEEHLVTLIQKQKELQDIAIIISNEVIPALETEISSMNSTSRQLDQEQLSSLDLLAKDNLKLADFESSLSNIEELQNGNLRSLQSTEIIWTNILDKLKEFGDDNELLPKQTMTVTKELKRKNEEEVCQQRKLFQRVKETKEILKGKVLETLKKPDSPRLTITNGFNNGSPTLTQQDDDNLD